MDHMDNQTMGPEDEREEQLFDQCCVVCGGPSKYHKSPHLAGRGICCACWRLGFDKRFGKPAKAGSISEDEFKLLEEVEAMSGLPLSLLTGQYHHFASEHAIYDQLQKEIYAQGSRNTMNVKGVALQTRVGDRPPEDPDDYPEDCQDYIHYYNQTYRKTWIIDAWWRYVAARGAAFFVLAGLSPSFKQGLDDAYYFVGESDPVMCLESLIGLAKKRAPARNGPITEKKRLRTDCSERSPPVSKKYFGGS